MDKRRENIMNEENWKERNARLDWMWKRLVIKMLYELVLDSRRGFVMSILEEADKYLKETE